jgi:hypothetical protein
MTSAPPSAVAEIADESIAAEVPPAFGSQGYSPRRVERVARRDPRQDVPAVSNALTKPTPSPAISSSASASCFA